MEVFKRPGSPNWYVDMVHPRTGERIRQSLKFKGSKVEAQKKARQLEAELEQKPAKDEVTVGQALDRYVEALAAKGKVSAKNHAYRRDRLFAEGLLSREDPLTALTPAKMEELVLARTAAGKKPQTIKHDINLVRAATRYAVALGAVAPAALERSANQNPWRVPKVGVKTRYLSPKEFELVRRYLDPHRLDGKPIPDQVRAARGETYDLLIALAYTGGRWSEVAGLTWDRVNLAEGTIRLYAGKVERERVVPISSPLEGVLRRRLAERSTSPFVFPGPGGQQRRQPANGIGEAMDAVGLNNDETVLKYGTATIHSLRHTFASWLIQNGADLGEVADALGHANMNMTKRYAHLSKGKTLAKLGGILNGITTPQGDTARASEEPEHDRGTVSQDREARD